MSAEGVAGEPSRLEQWLDEYAEGLLERKYRLEAIYASKRAERAENRGDFETAEQYYDRARSLNGKLGDREAAIELGTAHARTAYENGNVGTTRKHYERAINLHARRENAKGALDALEPLLEILEAEGENDDLQEWWGHAMMVLGKAEPGEIADDRRDALVDRYAEQIRTEDSAGRLYGFAVQRFLEGDEETGADLLAATWDRKEVVREAVGQFRVLLAAGVGLVAYSELADREDGAPADRDIDREAVLSVVADDRERLSEAATALFEYLHEGETHVDPADLRRDLDPQDPNELRDVESEVFGRFLEELA
jgi:tetratricopeptide (TPR) repeat protein